MTTRGNTGRNIGLALYGLFVIAMVGLQVWALWAGFWTALPYLTGSAASYAMAQHVVAITKLAILTLFTKFHLQTRASTKTGA